MPTGGSVGITQSGSKGTGRTQQGAIFPKQFLLDYTKAFGGPFTTNDLFNLAPRGHSLFGYADQGQVRPGGGFNLGFGAPTPGSIGALTGGGAGGRQQPGTGGQQPGTGDLGTEGGDGGGGAQTYSLSDLTTSYAADPDKVMDLPRLFRTSGLDPKSFTYDQFSDAIDNAKWASGRSRKNFALVLADLQRDQDISGAYGGTGGKGSGIF